MPWQLAPHVSFCVASGRVIFLDLASDRYVALPTTLGPGFCEWVAGGAAGAGPEALPLLVRAGLLCPADAPGVIRPVASERAIREISIDAANTPSFSRLIPVVASSWRARRRLARLGLAATLDRALGARPSSANGSEARCAAAFMSVRRHLPLPWRCLPDALAMLDYLARRGACASIVFGVTSNPFQAHCWLQSGDQLLNDRLDRVAAFTPILVR